MNRNRLVWGLAVLSVALGFGWASREFALAREGASTLGSQTLNVDQLNYTEATYQGAPVGKNGVYLIGDTPASSKFVTGRFVLAPGKTPHAPHTHVEEEIMIIESGDGEIFCDGKTTKVG